MLQGLCLFKGVRLFQTLEYTIPYSLCLDDLLCYFQQFLHAVTAFPIFVLFNIFYQTSQKFKILKCAKSIDSVSQRISTTTNFIKVSTFQNEFLKSLFLRKYEPNIVRISALYCTTLQGRNPYNFWFIFWEKRWLHKFILKFTDPYFTVWPWEIWIKVKKPHQ